MSHLTVVVKFQGFLSGLRELEISELFVWEVPSWLVSFFVAFRASAQRNEFILFGFNFFIDFAGFFLFILNTYRLLFCYFCLLLSVEWCLLFRLLDIVLLWFGRVLMGFFDDFTFALEDGFDFVGESLGCFAYFAGWGNVEGHSVIIN